MKRWWKFLIIFILGIILSLKMNSNLLARQCDRHCDFSNAAAIEIAPSQLVRQAQEFYRNGKFTESLQLLQQAQKIYANQKKPLQQAQIFSLTAQIYRQTGNLKLAEKNIANAFTSIKKIALSQAKTQVLGQIWNAKGHLEFARGDNYQALADWKQAEELYRQAKDSSGVVESLLDRARVLETMGFYNRSCDRLIEALGHSGYDCDSFTPSQIKVITEGVTEPQSWQIRALNQLSNILLLKGKISQAETILQVNQNISSELPDLSPLTKAQISLSLGNINKAIAFRAKAIQDNSGFNLHLQKATEYYQQLNKDRTNSQIAFEYQLPAQLNLLSLSIAARQWSKAQDLADRIQLYPKNLASKRNLYGEIKFALELERLKQNKVNIRYSWQDIADIYLDAVEEGKKRQDLRVQSYALGYLGMLQIKQNRIQTKTNPQQLISQALELAKQNKTPETIYRWQWQLGKIYAAKKQRRLAISSYQASLITLASLRNDLTSLTKEIQFDFHEQIEPIYKEYVDLLLTGESISNEDLATAVETIESLQVAELDNYFQDACTISNIKDVHLSEKNAVAIYTLTLPDRLEVIMAMDNSASNSGDRIFRHHTTPISQGKLEITVEQLRSNITEPDRAVEVKELSTQLYSLLIEPFEPDLIQIQPKNLVFILDGILQTVPMSVLYDGEQYLLEKYAIVLTPGLKMVNLQDSAEDTSFLVGGITQPLQIEEQKFSALNNVKTELDWFSQANSKVLLDKDFTSENLLNEISITSASHVHIATHGQFNSNPDQTFLLMWQQLLTIKEFSDLLQTRQQKTNIPLELLVLSACNTASGEPKAALGLAGVAVRSGAKTTLATLWQVNDESTAALMKSFYQHLKSHSKAEALRLAQLELWQRSDKDWQVPAFWSPYITIGNWE